MSKSTKNKRVLETQKAEVVQVPIKNTSTTRWNSFKKTIASKTSSLKKRANLSPFVLFILIFALLIVSIVIGSIFNKPKVEPIEEPKPSKVTTLSVGAAPTFKTQATIEKTGVLTIVAQTAGYIQKLPVSEGNHVKRKTQLASISTNARGANASSVARALSGKNYQFVLDTYEDQKSSIQINKQITEKAEAQASEVREIARKSHDDTKTLISLNEEIIKGLDSQISALEQSNIGGVNDPDILIIKSSKSQILGALSGLRTGLRTSEYLNDNSQEPAEIARLSKEATLKQLAIQEKSLDLNKDLAALNLKLAQITESLSFPTSPCAGTVERVHVKMGEYINPGTVLFTIRADDQSAQALALIPSSLAKAVSTYETSTLTVGEKNLKLFPEYVSQEPTVRGLHTIIYQLPEDVTQSTANESTITIEIPLQKSWQDQPTVFVPLDAVHFSQNAALVYTIKTTGENNDQQIAASTPIDIAEVIGDTVRIQSGLKTQDTIILTRSIQDGEKVATN